ncbi:MAG: lysophospholipid acyltransferase family protein [Candidatus Krumholzibacteria bacterium]|nr:lysophospholipid acyltransferase family protein [Candidatus Krumholzibacteria bacterium]
MGWKTFQYRLELFGVRLLSSLPLLFPYKWSIKAGGLIGAFAFDVVRIRRRVTLENLERAFGDGMTSAERVRTGRRAYVNFTKSMVELASLPRLSKEKLRDLVRIHGRENMDAAFAEGKGVIVVTGHFGSWELLGASGVAQGIPVDFIVGEQTNTLVDDYINNMRRSAGIGVIPKGIAVRGVFGSLKKNRSIAILSDQDARQAGIFVDFFGIPSSTYPGAAQFVWKTGCPMVFCSIIRRKDETHDAWFKPAMHADTEAAGEGEIPRLTAAFTKELENAIRKNPDHYFWAHKRWKTSPPE